MNNIFILCLTLGLSFGFGFNKIHFFLKKIKKNSNIIEINSIFPYLDRRYLKTNLKNSNRNYSPFGKMYYEKYLKKLNSNNNTIQEQCILNQDYEKQLEEKSNIIQRFRNYSLYNGVENPFISINIDHSSFSNTFNKNQRTTKKKSENFEIIQNFDFSFKNIGGYDNIKEELYQCVDILTNYSKYNKFNVRIPKGLIFEGPPGNGKTMLAKGFAGETNTSFISVSGSEFQEKYVGVGSSRVKELFELARENIPCVIFIDEIDAIGRKRSTDPDSSSNERDNTLNELLVQLDGFKNNSGLFLIGATNRIDLLDPALLRPGRVDKKIYIGFPDSKTRESIIKIHLYGKPYNSLTISVKDLVDITNGLSGAQIENIFNEAMLYSLRCNREEIQYEDINLIINKLMVGWQPNEHEFSNDLIDRIAIHEMGHAIVGLNSKHHSKLIKVVINLSSPQSPGYTIFESNNNIIHTRESLFEHLMILLAGRIAEEIFYDISVTTGAINDFEEAFKLAERMVTYYGMGKQLIYPTSSDKSKELIDKDVSSLIDDAYKMSRIILLNSLDIINECYILLKNEKILHADKILELMTKHYLK
jgi:cell division protease FtsH